MAAGSEAQGEGSERLRRADVERLLIVSLFSSGSFTLNANASIYETFASIIFKENDVAHRERT